MNNLIPSYNSLHLSLIIHLISMIFMNLKITISYIKIYNFKFKSIKVIFILIYHTKFKFQWKFINDLSLFPNRIVSQNLKKKKNVCKNVNYISNFKLLRIVSTVNLDSTAMFSNNDVTLSIELLNGKANTIIENEIRQLVNKFIGSSFYDKKWKVLIDEV